MEVHFKRKTLDQDSLVDPGSSEVMEDSEIEPICAQDFFCASYQSNFLRLGMIRIKLVNSSLDLLLVLPGATICSYKSSSQRPGTET